MKTYDVTCEREGMWWAMSVPAVAGAVTQAPNLEQMPFMAADAIESLSGRRVVQLRFTGADVVAVFRDQPPATDGPELDAALRVGFPDPTADDLAEAIAAHGHWQWIADDEGITCTRA